MADEPRVKFVSITCPHTPCFKLALLPGAEPAALSSAVGARAGLRPDAIFFLTATLPSRREDGEVVVPLSVALPDGLRLELHEKDDGRPRTSTAEAPQASASPKTSIGSRGSYRQDPQDLPPSRLARRSPQRSPPARQVVGFAPAPRPSPPSSNASNRGRFSSGGSEGLRDVRGSSGPLEPLLPNKGKHEEDDDEDDSSMVPTTTEERGWWTSGLWPKKAGGRGLRRRSLSLGNLGSFGLSYNAREEEKTDTSEEKALVCAMERFSRLSSELANERTLLAWVRTSLAAVRTGLSYIGLTAHSEEWWFFLLLNQWAMIALILVAAVAGAKRYYKLRSVLEMKQPPRTFGRVGTTPFLVIMLMAVGGTCIGLFARAWHK